VWDREFGFLREMLVAPVSRTALVLGKCLGGATVATFQGIIILLLAPFVGIPWSFTLVAVLLAELALLAFTLTAFGTMIAARISNMQAFMAVMQMATLPLFFLSGALFPLNNLPGWLTVLTHLNPLTYAVAPLRTAVFSHLSLSPEAYAVLNPGVYWGSYQVTTWLELSIVAAFGLIALTAAVVQFRKTD
jgi:ABC-2 type transport system permease protein